MSEISDTSFRIRFPGIPPVTTEPNDQLLLAYAVTITATWNGRKFQDRVSLNAEPDASHVFRNLIPGLMYAIKVDVSVNAGYAGGCEVVAVYISTQTVSGM